jgi:hypothetical protein
LSRGAQSDVSSGEWEQYASNDHAYYFGAHIPLKLFALPACTGAPNRAIPKKWRSKDGISGKTKGSARNGSAPVVRLLVSLACAAAAHPSNGRNSIPIDPPRYTRGSRVSRAGS